MKTLLISVIFLATASITAQETVTYIMDYPKLETEADYRDAIRYYGDIIKTQGEYRDAYYKRGLCEMRLKEYRAAIFDFSQAIRLDKRYLDAYYNRAVSYNEIKAYEEAINDMNTIIKENPSYPKAYKVRGLLHELNYNRKLACEDFYRAKQINEAGIEELIKEYCPQNKVYTELLGINWGDIKWDLVSNTEDDNIQETKLVKANTPKDNSGQKWTSISYKNSKNKSLTGVMNTLFDDAKKRSRFAKLTVIEKNENGAYPWIMFTIENYYDETNARLEAYYYFVLQGNTNLFLNEIQTPDPTIPIVDRILWKSTFKNYKVIYR